MLPRILPAIRREFPKLDLYIREDQTQSLYTELMRGGLDIILAALPYEMKNAQTMPLFKDRFLLAAHKNTQLIEKPEEFRVARLKHGDILLLEEGHCLRDHVLAAMKSGGGERLNKFAATSLHTLIQMVDSDLGISFIPKMAQGSSLVKGANVALYPMTRGYVREIALVWRGSSARGDEFTRLGEVIKKKMAPKTADGS